MSPSAPEDGSSQVMAPRLPAPGVPGRRVDPESPATLFVWVAIIGVLLFGASMGIAYWMGTLRPQVHPTAIDPPISFQSATLLSRVERLELALREAAATGAQPRGEAELKVLRVRAETVGSAEDVRRVMEAVDEWERRYTPP